LPSLCKYGENNKRYLKPIPSLQQPLTKRRGIPGGYLYMLEQRLTETEVALFDIMEQLQTSRLTLGIPVTASNSRVPGIDISRSSIATKTMRMAEWKRLPLETAQNIETWWQCMNSDWGLGPSKLNSTCMTSLLSD
jgi:hypothetical protein